MGRNSPGRVFDHVLIIMFENQYRSYVLSNPYFRRLARHGIQLGSSFGVMHPSQTNYVASVAGWLCGVTSDQQPALLPGRTIVDLIEEAPGRLRWKAYMDSYVPQATPWTPQLTPRDALPYVVKHNPFALFESVVRSQARWRRIDNEAGLFADLLNGEFPEYAWFTPNMWNDGHWLDGTELESKPRAPGLVDQSARWLEGFFARLKFPGPDTHLPPRTLVVVTFDEADFDEDYLPDQDSPYDGPNQIYTVLLGDMIEPGGFEEEGYNHYSLLRTIEQNFGLGHLGKNDAGANWFQFLWGRRFRWGAATETPLTPRAGLAAAGFGDALFVAHADDNGIVCVRTLAHAQWSAPELLPVDGSGGVALASTFETLVLVACAADGALMALTWDAFRGWSPPEPVGDGARDLALASYDGERRIMLVVRGDDDLVHARSWSQHTWGPVVPVPAATTDGPLTLAALGASLYLVVKTPGANSMSVVSYNSAPFNVVTVLPNNYGGPQDETVLDRWAPSAFLVSHFSAWPDDRTGARQPLAHAYECGGPLALATLDGVMHLVHPGVGSGLLLEETFSLAGLMTPANPVSYKCKDTATASNGFGTLAEGGWTKPSPLYGARCDRGGALALGRADHSLYLFSQPGPGAPVELRVGRYVAG